MRKQDIVLNRIYFDCIIYTDPDYIMSEEASDVTTGSAPGKRPLELSSDGINADSDDSSVAPKRLDSFSLLDTAL